MPRGTRNPNKPLVTVVANVKPEAWQALKILAKAHKVSLAGLVTQIVMEGLARLGIRPDLDQKAPEVIEKLQAPEPLGPPTSVHSSRLDPQRFVRG